MLNILPQGSNTTEPPLLIAPGLFGSARNWGVIAKRLSEDRRVLALDMRNHGDSFWSDTQDYPAMASDLAWVIENQGRAAPAKGPLAREADVMGHSMGGKASMVLALTRPDLVRKLVVADIAPVAYEHSHSGLIEAMQAMDLTDLTSRSEADRRLAQSISDPSTRAFLLQSLELRDGPVRWKFNLDVLQSAMQTLVGWPAAIEPQRTGGGRAEFTGPVLFVFGKNSSYVQPADHGRILDFFPKAEFVGIEGAGHWLHAEKPREFEAVVAEFLARD